MMTPKVEGIQCIFEGLFHHGGFYLYIKIYCLDWLRFLFTTWLLSPVRCVRLFVQ